MQILELLGTRAVRCQVNKFFIIIIRLPIALVTSPLLMIFFLLVLETPLALICLPFAAVFMKRNDIKRFWRGSFLKSVHWMTESLKKTWQWALPDETVGMLGISCIEPDNDRTQNG
jgi:hypothetical protein